MIIRFYAVGREIANCHDYRAVAVDFQSLRSELEDRFGKRMGQLFDAASLMSDGQRVTADSNIQWNDNDVVDLLPPFAGG